MFKIPPAFPVGFADVPPSTFQSGILTAGLLISIFLLVLSQETTVPEDVIVVLTLPTISIVLVVVSPPPCSGIKFILALLLVKLVPVRSYLVSVEFPVAVTSALIFLLTSSYWKVIPV